MPDRSWKNCGFRRVENQAGERKVVCGHLPTYRVGQCPPLLEMKQGEFPLFWRYIELFESFEVVTTLMKGLRNWVVTIGQFP